MKREDVLFGSVMLGATVFAGLCVQQIRAQQRAAVSQASAFRLPAAATRTDVLGSHPHLEGVAGAPVTLVEWGDYQCPPCRSAYEKLRQMLPLARGRWNLAFRHYPLTEMHPYAYDAAVMAQAAGEQGQFWQMHDLLYQHNTALERSHLDEYARLLHLDPQRLASDRVGSAKRQVDADMATANAYGMPGTPSFVVIDQDGKSAPISLEEFVRRNP